MADDRAPIEHERSLPVGPEQAFAGWVDMGRWWPPTYTANPETLVDVVVGPGVGAPVVHQHRDLGDLEVGRITRWEPAVAIGQTFSLAMSAEHPSTVEVRFEAVDGATRLRFSHGGWTADNVEYRAKFGDWPLILDAYVASLTASDG